MTILLLTAAGIRPFGQLAAWPLLTQALAWPLLSHADATRMGTRSRSNKNRKSFALSSIDYYFYLAKHAKSGFSA